jgi:methyl-accepting chemotaxis protein
MTEMSATVREVAENTATSSASGELASHAEDLVKLVGRFRT